MKLQKTFLTIAVAGMMAVPAVARPGDGRGCPHHDGEKPHRMWSALDLSEDQKSQLKELHQEMLTARKEHRQKVKELRGQIRDELAKDNPSRGALDNFVARQADLHKAMSDQRIDHLLNVKEVLTKEQFEKLLDKQWIEKHGCGGKRFHRGGPHGGGGRGKCCAR
ncbi:MAG: periplasmic heavy metal sensor [Chitinivibrionales bacterium]|nr:periplasmic heavy metal sensor [Chitinivibrionales bacterium]MBD3357376.1 periplasmic heavy metal sensor [Chitinivibrionales bacterium]